MNSNLIKIKRAVQKEAPILLSLTGISGFITGAIMAAKATPKAVEVLKEHEEYLPYGGRELIWEQFKLLAPIYAPTAGLLAISAAFVLGSTQLSRYRYGAATTLYFASQQSLVRLQEAVLDNVGAKKYDEIRADAAAPPKDSVPPSIIINGENSLFWDVFSGRYFHSGTIEDVRKVINDMNAHMYEWGYVSLNELYQELGMPKTEYGDLMGWFAEDGAIDVRFSSRLTENDRACISMELTLTPKHSDSPYGGHR